MLVTNGTDLTALYGACVSGVSDGLLMTHRPTSAAAINLRAAGRSLETALALHSLDPTADATGPPLLGWDREVWEATQPWNTRAIPVAALRQIWTLVSATRCNKWCNMRGPLTAAALSAKRLGW